MRTIQLYGTGSATATSVAQITIPAATSLKSVLVSLVIDSITDNTLVRCELSRVPTNQIGVNGAVDAFCEVGIHGNFVTSGLAEGSVVEFIPLDVQCRQGEIIYLHVTVAGTVTYYFNAIFNY